MNWCVLAFFLGTFTVSVVWGATDTLDDAADELVTTNDKLDEVAVNQQKIDDFLTRFGYFYTFCIPQVEYINEQFGASHGHETHSPTLIIDNYGWGLEQGLIGELEKLNGYLSWVVDTQTMDSFT